jgi:hypothetical protein
VIEQLDAPKLHLAHVNVVLNWFGERSAACRGSNPRRCVIGSPYDGWRALDDRS